MTHSLIVDKIVNQPHVEEIQPVSEGIAPVLQKRLRTYFATLQSFSNSGNLHTLVMQEVERLLIQETLTFCDQNQSKAAAILGINRNTLRKKLSQFSSPLID